MKKLILTTICLFVLCNMTATAQRADKTRKKLEEALKDNDTDAVLRLSGQWLEEYPHDVETRLLRMDIYANSSNNELLCDDINILRLYGRNEVEKYSFISCPDSLQARSDATDITTTTASSEVPEEMPVYPGGDEAQLKDLVKHLTYPQDCLERGISGRVYISFVVEKNGTISHVQVLKGIDGGRSLEMEACKAIYRLQPYVSPAKMNGKPVRMQMTLPVVFSLK